MPLNLIRRPLIFEPDLDVIKFYYYMNPLDKWSETDQESSVV